MIRENSRTAEGLGDLGAWGPGGLGDLGAWEV